MRRALRFFFLAGEEGPDWTVEGFAVKPIRFDMVRSEGGGRGWKCSNEMNSEGMGVIVDLFGKVWGAPRLVCGWFGLEAGSYGTISNATAGIRILVSSGHFHPTAHPEPPHTKPPVPIPNQVVPRAREQLFCPAGRRGGCSSTIL